MKRLNRYGKKVLNELHTLENRRHNINRKLASIRNTYAWVMYGTNNELMNSLELEKGQVVRKIRKIRSFLMGASR